MLLMVGSSMAMGFDFKEGKERGRVGGEFECPGFGFGVLS